MERLIRIVVGVVFVAFSVGKFTRHDAESAAFDRYGLPFPDLTTYAVGVLELVGGLALVTGILIVPFAAMLACNMVGAIVTAGRIEGDIIHLGLAPVLLVSLLWILRRASVRRSAAAPRRPETGPSRAG